MMEWDDPGLCVASDSPRRARWRRHQGWWRQQVMGLEPGRDGRGVVRTNLLPRTAVAADPGLNFLSPAIARYVDARVPEVLAQNGTLDEDRLRRNLLSSMPLCFNVFGMFRSEPDAAARVLAAVTGVAIAHIDEIEVEWTPPGLHPLGDRTAFDAWVSYRDDAGRRGFFGVETKYTEPFSERVYDKPRYRELTGQPESGFGPHAADRMRQPDTNQLWRNALLAVAVRQSMAVDEGRVLVIALADDPHVEQAMTALRTVHPQSDSLVISVGLESLVAAARSEASLREWAQRFAARYVDDAPRE